MFGSSLPRVVCQITHVLSALFELFAYSGVQHILCCFCFVCLRLVYPMLPVSMDCTFMIAPSVFSNVNLLTIVKLRSIYNVDSILRIVRQCLECLECRNYSEMLILSKLIVSRLDRNYSHY